MELYGGRDKLLAKLEGLLLAPAVAQPGTYKVEIHEMREMYSLNFGQYAHNNQPVHHVPYLFAMLGDHNATARLVRAILLQAYAPDAFCGDEDNGEMGAWYVLGAMGLYAAAVGTTEDYVTGAVPLFRDVTWRSTSVKQERISYSQLRSGGVLRFI